MDIDVLLNQSITNKSSNVHFSYKSTSLNDRIQMILIMIESSEKTFPLESIKG